MQERAAIASLVLAQLGRVHEEGIAHGEQCIRTRAAPRQLQIIRVAERQRVLRALGTQVLAELVAQVRGGIALGKYRRGREAVNRAVVAGDEHRDALARRVLEQREEHRALEPLLGDLPERDLVLCNLVQDRGLAAPVREQVTKLKTKALTPSRAIALDTRRS